MNTQRILGGIDDSLLFLSKPSNNNPTSSTLGLHILNELISYSTLDKSSPLMTSTETIRVIEKLIINNKSKMTGQVQLRSTEQENLDLKVVYDALVDMLISYKTENSILLAKQMGNNFPYIDVISNSVLFVVTVVMLIIIFKSINPVQVINDIKQYNAAIRNQDTELIHCMLVNEDKFNKVNFIVILSCTVIVIVFAVLINISKVIASGSNYSVMLYNSKLYENRMAYNMKA